MVSRAKKILIFARAAEEVFTTGEWTELGYMTETDDYIDRHPRLLRSLRWGDPDYKEHVLDTIGYILDSAEPNFAVLLEYKPLAHWLRDNDPGAYEALRAEIAGGELERVELQTTTDAALAALTDAQALLRERGPTSAVDRIHTGLHAFLKAACDGVGIQYDREANANRLLKLLLENHENLQDLGPRTEDIRRMIRTSASIVDTLGTLRNQASRAHPTEELLGHEEALFVISLTRSLLRFLDAKIAGTE